MIARPGLLGALMLIGVGFAPQDAPAQETHRGILVEKLHAALADEAEAFTGVAGWHVLDLTTGETFSHNEDLIFPQGSSIKITVLLELFRRGDLQPGLLSTRLPIRESDMVGGSGVLRHLTDAGTEMSLHDLAIYMILYSDNTATNLLIDYLGMARVNGMASALGAPSTVLQRKMIQSAASARGDENLSTPLEATAIMAAIARCDLPMSEASCFRVQEILEIPKGGAFADPLPTAVPVAWKPGGITGVATAWGIVGLERRPYAISVMTNYGSSDTVDGRYGRGGELVRRVSGLVFDYFTKLDGATEYGTRVSPSLMRRVRGGGN